MRELALRWTSRVAAFALAAAPACAFARTPNVDTGDTAWMMVATLLVMLMIVPGLALFYGGLVRQKNVLSTMMHSMILMAVVSLIWFVCGYSLAFGTGNFFCGNPLQYLFLHGVGGAPNPDYAPTIPHQSFMIFQLMFAIITPALISGAYAERIKFSAMLLFSALWMLLVYCPLAHMVWGKGGLFNWALGGSIPALDFAGGAVVHISSGVSALVCALVLGRREGYPQQPMPPHNLVISMTGAGLLWVGWFGFNAGSALSAGTGASSAFAATHFATAAAAVSWITLEWLVGGKPSALGAISGMVAGLVVITPAAGFVSIPAAVAMGLIGGAICFLSATRLKAWLGYDDSLDAFGIHGVGGIVGALLTGLFASALVNPAIASTFTRNGHPVSLEGGLTQFGHQAIAVAITLVFAGLGSFLLLKLVQATVGLRPTASDEIEGLDLSQHGETAYHEAVQ